MDVLEILNINNKINSYRLRWQPGAGGDGQRVRSVWRGLAGCVSFNGL
ncbi:hypothetical protein HMPREF9418_0247 [Neisseria macacae ATCC 33926]|uniref:Uncharacterized protein n=1 Tax=Neisseria macacae ATCC 33926 TaxID=997348 RepID=A0AA36ULH6_9NEIS|nr:hypothetical protein HMPREF9418_0247 [Neisseria macacae ATCC 33926]